MNETIKSKDMQEDHAQTPPHFEPIPRRYEAGGKRFAQNYRKRETHWLIRTLIITFILAVVLRLFVFQSVQVKGPSMQPTLETNDLVMVDKISYTFSSPKHQQVVVFQSDALNELLIKRIIGLEGDVIEISEGLVYVNGVQIEDPHAAEKANEDMVATIVPKGHLFVMGDNRNRSSDSRNPLIGMVPMEKVVGKGILVFWPLRRVGGV